MKVNSSLQTELESELCVWREAKAEKEEAYLFRDILMNRRNPLFSKIAHVFKELWKVAGRVRDCLLQILWVRDR